MILLLLACNDYALTPNNDVGHGERDTAACQAYEPLDYSVEKNPDCVNEPTVGTFDPVIEWQWTENPINPGYDDIMSAPAVGHVTDDDWDGDVDEDDVPDIVFTTFSGGAYTSAGTLQAISGDGSGTHFSISSIEGHGFYASSGVAIGDLESDGIPEICVSGTSAAVVCISLYNGIPDLKFASGTELYGYGCPSIADLDGDGLAEVMFGRQIFDYQGNLVGIGEHGTGRSMSFAVDMDGDHQLELVTGNAVYERDGSTTWTDGGYDGIPAVADFDLDGTPEHVRSGDGYVTVTWLDGSQSWRTQIPGGGSGGPPTVADFDGDGFPEVGVAALSYYTVYDTNGEVLWSNPVSDYSSSVTGSAVFDFEADGDAEVVYTDEHTLWIFEGLTGEVLMAQEGHASGTLYEYPLIADVDGDDSTEIVVASNNYAYSGWNGITVVGDANSSWAPARPVWNQFAYHITNIENDNGVPLEQTPNWLSWNSFRAGGSELGPSHWLPDLVLGEPELCYDECFYDRMIVQVPVENRGLGGVKNVELHVGDQVQKLNLHAGEAKWSEPVTLKAKDWGEELILVVDPEDLLGDCAPEDNLRNLGPWPCD
jgi:hypothetical protein